MTVKTANGALLIEAPAHSSVNVYTLDGRTAYSGKTTAATTTVALHPGIYVVKVNNQVAKVSLQ